MRSIARDEPKQQRARAKNKKGREFFWTVGPPHFFNPGDAAVRESGYPLSNFTIEDGKGSDERC